MNLWLCGNIYHCPSVNLWLCSRALSMPCPCPYNFAVQHCQLRRVSAGHRTRAEHPLDQSSAAAADCQGTMPCHAMPCHAMPCHARSCNAVPCHAVPYRAVARAVPCCAGPCRVMPCHAMSYRAGPCRVMQCRAMPRRAAPCRAAPCRSLCTSRDMRTCMYARVPAGGQYIKRIPG